MWQAKLKTNNDSGFSCELLSMERPNFNIIDEKASWQPLSFVMPINDGLYNHINSYYLGNRRPETLKETWEFKSPEETWVMNDCKIIDFKSNDGKYKIKIEFAYCYYVRN